MLETDNQKRTEELSAKVNRLKHLTIDMDKELKDQNKFMDNFGFDFNSTGNLLKGSVNRIAGMVDSNRSNRKAMFYMIVVIVVGFLLLYKIFTRVNV